MEYEKLPTIRRGNRTAKTIDDMTGDLHSFLPSKTSKQTTKRIQTVREEALVRITVTKAQGVLEKLATDYRDAAKRYEATKLRDSLRYYLSLVDDAESETEKRYMIDIVKAFFNDLYTFIMELSQDMDEKTKDLYLRDLYPETEEERDWLAGIAAFLKSKP